MEQKHPQQAIAENAMAEKTGAGSAADDDLLTPAETADWLGVSARTLEGWRIKGGAGPPYVRLSRRCVRYRRGGVREHLASRTFASTSAEAAAK